MVGVNQIKQRGGTFLGFIAGVVVGLAAALVVAVYVTKVPVPFLDRSNTRSPEQDVSEVKKNKDWDPNAPLYGKNPAKPAVAEQQVANAKPVASKVSGASAPGKPEVKPAVTADPIGELVKSQTAGKDAAANASATEPFNYFVQVGAFRTNEDAESQRAKLSLAGIETKISEREQAGRIVFRVRTGPHSSREEADQSKAKLDRLGIDTALVRVQR